jgi:hypothetical protein
MKLCFICYLHNDTQLKLPGMRRKGTFAKNMAVNLAVKNDQH